MSGNTFTWTAGAIPNAETLASNWLWIGGSAGSIIAGPPGTLDTAIVTVGTVLMKNDATLTGNTVEIAGTGGTAAAVVFQGDGSITLGNPTVDGNSVIESLVQGQSAAGATVLDSLGTFINTGTIEANGPDGSSFTIDVSQGTAGNAGAFLNEGQMSVGAGDAMTIAVGTNAAFYNASDIQVIGGSLLLTTLAAGAFDGGYAPVRGVVVIGQTATVEDNIAYDSTVSGSAPVFAFIDNASNTLKLDQQAQFGGRILGFAHGDTIDLGTGLTVTSFAYNPTDGVLSLLDSGTTVSSLVFTSGDFSSASFQTTVASGDMLLTTTGTNDVWTTNGGGTFTTGSNWSGGAPGAASSVLIGTVNPNLTGTITTGGASLSVQSLLLVGQNETLFVSGSLGVSSGPLDQGGGTIEVATGSTLGVTALSQLGGGALILDSGAHMNVAGRASLGFANGGTLLPSSAGAYGVLLQGSGFINGGTLDSTGYVNIGVEGGGTPAQVTVSAGGIVTDTSSFLNSGPTSFGSLTLSGASTQWTDAGSVTDPQNTSGYMLVGYNDLGTALPYAGAAGLTVTNGATLTDQGFAKIGADADSAGIANVSSGGVWNIGLASGGFLLVGASGTGSLEVAGGTVAVGGNGTVVANGTTTANVGGIGIGRFAGGVGTVAVDGGLLSSADGISVGYQGTGYLAVNGGTVLTTANGIGIAIVAGSSGTVLVSGAGSDIIITGTTSSSNGIGVGKAGFGAMTIASGGTVLLTDTGGGVGVGQSAGAFGSLVIGGGNALLSLGTATQGIGAGTKGGAGVIEVQSGGTVAVDSANSGIGLGETTGASGTLVVSGAGALVTLGANNVGFGVGYNGGSGLLEIMNGGAVSLASGGIGVGASLGTGSILVGSGGLLTLAAGATNGVFIGAGLVEVLAGGTIANTATGLASGIHISNTGTLAGDGLVNSVVYDLGTIVALAGSIGAVNTLEIADSVTGTGAIGVGSYGMLRLDFGLGAGGGTIAMGAGATLAVGAAVTGNDAITFAGSGAGGEMVLEQPGGSFSNAVQNLSGGDIIALANFSTITSATLTGTTITVTGSIGNTATIYQLTDVTFAGSQTGLIVNTVTDPFSNGLVQAIEVACYAAGTRLAVPGGEAPVEALRPGDLVRTAGGALRPVRWIGHRTIDLTRHPDPRRAQPIRILADAFADGVPSRDLVLSPDHAVFDRGRLIPVRLLVNGATILRETRRRKVTYYHVELDSHDLLLAEGLAAESFLDCGNRGIFENAPEPLILHPDFLDPAAQTARRLATSCAPLCDAAAAIEPVWFRLADRALALGVPLPEPAFTDDPALAVLAGETRLAPMAREGARYRFAVPAGVPLRLVSRAAYPSDARPWEEDQRRLGVMVRALTLGEGPAARPIALDDPALRRGWWASETDGVSRWRWTDGAAALPALEAASVLTVELAGTLPYPRPALSRRVRATG